MELTDGVPWKSRCVVRAQLELPLQDLNLNILGSGFFQGYFDEWTEMSAVIWYIGLQYEVSCRNWNISAYFY